MSDELKPGQVEGYRDSEQFELDFLAIMMGIKDPIEAIEKIEGTEAALEVARGCQCDACQGFIKLRQGEVVA